MKLSNQNPAIIPSYFGAPICGHAFDVSLAGSVTTTVMRERLAAQFKGDMGLVAGYVPGTSAWSPPSS
jgi:hypothetical protein